AAAAADVARAGAPAGEADVPAAPDVPVPPAASSSAFRPPGVCGTLGSVPQETFWSRSPPKPDWRERSAAQAEAGSGRLPCWASAAGPVRDGSSTGSSSKKCGPVSSTEGAAPGGGASDSPLEGAGRLVPGTHADPFQYRTYPGMDGSG